MRVDKVKINQIVSLIKRAKTDKLAEFFAYAYATELRAMQEANFQNVVTICKEYNVRYIHLGFTELAGCEARTDENRWPAMWKIAKRLDISCCGNSDQAQIEMGPWFPHEAQNYWDLQEMRILTPKEVSELNFKNVCEKNWPGRYSAPLSYNFGVLTKEDIDRINGKHDLENHV